MSNNASASQGRGEVSSNTDDDFPSNIQNQVD